MPGNEQQLIDEFVELCKSAQFKKIKTSLKKSKEVNNFKLEDAPLLRGQLIEDELIIKFFEFNKTKALHKVQISPLGKKVFPPQPSPKFSRFVYNQWFKNNRTIYNSNDVIFREEKLFKAKSRCLTKISIGYCFIDLILDDTIIDIKTDIHSKNIKKHLKQLLIHSIMYSSFLKSKIKFHSAYSLQQVKKIKEPINNIAIFFWRTNELYKYDLNDLIPRYKFNRLVRIYCLLGKSYSTELRKIMRKFML